MIILVVYEPHIDLPFSLNLKSALSSRKSSRYLPREVNIRYGSFVPLVTRSSIITPM